MAGSTDAVSTGRLSQTQSLDASGPSLRGSWRDPESIENNIYRIVQEACENALKYARAKSITIAGELSTESIDIKVTDDGIGFNTEISLKLDDMLANKHFGLAGMHERADLIGAVIRIDSKPNLGTEIWVSWKLNKPQSSAF